jgi:O-antigen/teichoic acid export membrane protein
MFSSNIFNKAVLMDLQDVGLRFTVGLSWGIVCIFIFFGKDILNFLYTDQDPALYKTLTLLMSAYFMVAVAYIFGTLLVAAGKLAGLTRLFGAGLLLNFVLNLMLIPTYQAFGAAIATFITQAIVTAGQIYLVRKEMRMYISKKTYESIALYTILAWVSMALIYRMEVMTWYVNLLLCGLICIILTAVTGLIQLSSGKKLLSPNAGADLQR